MVTKVKRPKKRSASQPAAKRARVLGRCRNVLANLAVAPRWQGLQVAATLAAFTVERGSSWRRMRCPPWQSEHDAAPPEASRALRPCIEAS